MIRPKSLSIQTRCARATYITLTYTIHYHSMQHSDIEINNTDVWCPPDTIYQTKRLNNSYH